MALAWASQVFDSAQAGISEITEVYALANTNTREAKEVEPVAEEWERAGLPEWLQTQVLERYYASISHAFILHGPGVMDYGMDFNITLRNVMEAALRPWECVVFYDRSQGISFSSQSKNTKEVFRRDVLANTTPNDSRTDAEMLAPFRDPSAAINAMEKLLRKKNEKEKLCAFVLDMAEYVMPDADLAQMQQSDRQILATLERWGRDPVITSTGNIVILVTRNIQDLHQRLLSASAKYEAVEVPAPSREHRLSYIRWFAAENPSLEYADQLTHEKVADLTAGLTRVHIEDVFLKVIDRQALTLEDLRGRKEEILRQEYGDVIQVLEPKGGFDTLGGYEYLKEPLRRRIVRPLREGGNAEWGGVILAGPPGTGKTRMAEAAAYEAGITAVELRISKLLSKWVGESDKNLAKALRLIDSFGTVIVFIDELDVALPNRAGGDNDSGVSNRILATLMPFMADPKRRGRVVWFGATNRIDNVDAALKRVGRFDRIIPVLEPTQSDRTAILGVMLKDEHVTGLDAAIAAAVKVTDHYTAAELESMVGKAKELIRDKEQPDMAKALKEAAKVIKANTALVQLQTLISIRDCNDISLLPPDFVQAVNDQATADKIEELSNVTAGSRKRRDN